MLHLVNNKPFISFDDGIDFDRLHHEATEFMIRYPDFILGPQLPFRNDPPTVTRQRDVKYTEEDIKRLKELGPDKQLLYNKIVKKVLYTWNVYNLNDELTWDQRQEHRKEFFPETLSTMPYFVQVINELGIFSSIGWARIYATEPFNYTHVHRDFSDHISLDQFVYLNLGSKSLYLKHHGSPDRIYPNNKLIFFDAANYHGTDPLPYHSFSLRVDGVFSDVFMNTLDCSRLNTR